ncbi:hypothetical protein AQUSIP_11280 [Aquicella siphonis]|uniref:Uncharacterized protein n=1 Tax=Aquicella siphonis TaxID=254247 RepID=A0A5E4PHN8_9COXI|nr:DVU_2496 family lipoprotein [Aquicella siphonis]VVC75831.1 hypothetical protein AQUSIP_11280 [Aquicella siphonis]
MKACNLVILTLLSLIVPIKSMAVCKNVYTIGAYDKVFSNHAEVIKLGPLIAKDAPSTVPKSFLEADGSYGGGEAFCTIQAACDILMRQVESGVLPASENWHIYLLDADWDHDTYQLHPNDLRINRSVKVLKLVREKC